MATITRFEDLEIWQLARIYYNKISVIAEMLRNKKEYRFAEQIKSAAGSIMDNIAEGFDRNSRLEFLKEKAAKAGPRFIVFSMTNTLTRKNLKSYWLILIYSLKKLRLLLNT